MTNHSTETSPPAEEATAPAKITDTEPADTVRVTPMPDDPDAVLVYLPDITYLDTQAGPIEIGISRDLLPDLVAAIKAERRTARPVEPDNAHQTAPTVDLSDNERYARRKQARIAIEKALRADAHMWAHDDGPDFAVASDVAMDALGDTAAEILSDGTMLKSLRAENGQMVLELEPAREILLTLVASMRMMLDGYGAENYLETEVTAPAPAVSMDVRDGEHPLDSYTVTIQRRTRPTPHALRQRADRDRAKILEIVEAYVTESNDCGGLDCNDLVTRLADAGFELPGGED